MRYTKSLLIIICMISLAGCKQSNETVSSLTGIPKTTKVPGVTEEPITTLNPTKAVEMPTATPVPTPLPIGMPERKVVKANPDVESIPIEEAYFSGEAFREFIKETIDMNGDGFLSRQEREDVVELEEPGCYGRGKIVIDGLDWFPNVEKLEMMGEAEVYLDHHPGLLSINWNEMGASKLFVDGCDKLELIAVHMACEATVYVNNCNTMKHFSVWDGYLESFYASGVPNLEICVDWYEEFPKEFWLDDDAQIIWRLWSDQEESICLDNMGTRFEVTENGILYWDEVFSNRYEILINWLGVEVAELNLDEQVKQMKKMYCASVPECQRENGMTQVGVKTILFSPQKNSVYMVGEWLEGKLSTVHYYIIEFDETITEYVSLEEMIMASEQIEGLKKMKTMFFPE